MYSYSDAAVEWNEKWFLCFGTKSTGTDLSIGKTYFLLCGVAFAFIFLLWLIIKGVQTVKYAVTSALTKTNTPTLK